MSEDRDVPDSGQESVFLAGEADAWIFRNTSAIDAAEPSDPVLVACGAVPLPQTGRLIEIGGGGGRVAAGFKRLFAGWQCLVVDPSKEAIRMGRAAHPDVEFEVGSASDALTTSTGYDLLILAAVLHWIDRRMLARVVANCDAAVVDGGRIVIRDFDAPVPRANPYVHHAGLFTYKQDYPAIWQALGTYHSEYRASAPYGSAANPADLYDRWWATSVLRKDLFGRYARG